jgi:hypothetical protein
MVSQFRMSLKDNGNARRWMEAWRTAGPELEHIRREEIRNADTRRFVEVTSGILSGMQPDLPLRQSSGLVEQQRLFRRMRLGAEH